MLEYKKIKTLSNGVVIGLYGGNETISLPSNGNGKFDKPFSFGRTKAKLIMKYIKDIRDFAMDEKSNEPAKKEKNNESDKKKRNKI